MTTQLTNVTADLTRVILLVHLSYLYTVADDSDEESAVVRKEKRVARGKLIQKTNTKTHEKTSGSSSSLLILHNCAMFFAQLVVTVTAIVRMMMLVEAK